MSDSTMATATARSNIALVKYWGKRAGRANLPAVGSLSLTLSGLTTTTTVRFDPASAADQLFLDGEIRQGPALDKVCRVLDAMRSEAGSECKAVVQSRNNFPTAAGLASSASGFAALTAAAARALGLQLPLQHLAAIARLGSGSAPRSLFGGFVRLHPGTAADGSDIRVEALCAPQDFDLRLVVALTTTAAKAVGSTEGMERTRLTSAYYDTWRATHEADLDAAVQALCRRDFTALGEVTERSCFKMHACMLASAPPLLYFNAATLDLIRFVVELRRQGLEGYITIDAGPHVKVLCQPAHADAIARHLGAVAGVVRVLVECPGPGVEVHS